jgi:hypothetical protein
VRATALSALLCTEMDSRTICRIAGTVLGRAWHTTFRLALIILTAAVAVAGDVHAFPGKGIDFTVFRTYKMLFPKVMTKSGLRDDEPTLCPLIYQAIQKELAGKGLTETNGKADLEVAALATAVSFPRIEALIFSDTIDTTAITATAPIATIGRYNREGTLYVNLIDPHMNRSVWLGISTGALGKPQNVATDIKKAAQALFKRYPPVN